MSTIATNRKELLFSFEQVLRTFLESQSSHRIDASDIRETILPLLISEVPEEAFDPVQPFDKGALFFMGAIEEGPVGDWQHDLMRVHLNLPIGEPIVIYLTSPGGELNAGLALISTIYAIQRQGRKVHIHIQGGAASMASVITQVADKRIMERPSFMMLHKVNYSVQGSADDHEDLLRLVNREQDIIFGLYASRTGKPVSFYKSKLTKLDWYLTAQQALEEGLIDEIADPPHFAIPAVVPKTTAKGSRKAVSRTGSTGSRKPQNRSNTSRGTVSPLTKKPPAGRK